MDVKTQTIYVDPITGKNYICKDEDIDRIMSFVSGLIKEVAEEVKVTTLRDAYEALGLNNFDHSSHAEATLEGTGWVERKDGTGGFVILDRRELW